MLRKYFSSSKVMFAMCLLFLLTSSIVVHAAADAGTGGSPISSSTSCQASSSAAGIPSALPIEPKKLPDSVRASFSQISLNSTNAKSPYADQFPGKVPDRAEIVNNQSVEVNFDYRDLSYLQMFSLPDNWISTGLYAPAGCVVQLDVPSGTENLSVQVGAHRDNLSNSETWKRAPIIVATQKLAPGINKISSPFGGLIYLIPAKPKVNTKVTISISGAVKAPYFVLGQTSEEEWRKSIRNYPGPWAELQGQRGIVTVPSEDIRNLDNPAALMKKWDEFINAYDEIYGLSPNKTKPNRSPDRPFRFLPDIQLGCSPRCGAHNGYPMMFLLNSGSWKRAVDLDQAIHGEGIEHELGHNYQQNAWTWQEIVETTINIPILYRHGKVPLRDDDWRITSKYYDKAFAFINDNNPKKNFNDNTNDIGQIRLVMFMQLQKAYGWEFYTKLFTAFRESKEKMPDWRDPDVNQKRVDAFVVMATKISGEDLLEFFDKYGLRYSAAAKQKVTDMRLPKPKQAIWTLHEPDNLASSAAVSMTGTGTDTFFKKINDNDWNSNLLSVDNPTFPQYVTLNWSSGQTFDAVNLVTTYAKGQAPTNWDIEVSDDGSTNWIRVASSGNVNWFSSDGIASTKVSFDPVTNKKGVKVKINSANLTWKHYAISEIELFKLRTSSEAPATKDLPERITNPVPENGTNASIDDTAKPSGNGNVSKDDIPKPSGNGNVSNDNTPKPSETPAASNSDQHEGDGNVPVSEDQSSSGTSTNTGHPGGAAGDSNVTPCVSCGSNDNSEGAVDDSGTGDSGFVSKGINNFAHGGLDTNVDLHNQNGMDSVEQPVKAANYYVDVPANHWASAAIALMSEKHIVDGVTDIEFQPSARVTRAQFVTMIVRAFDLQMFPEKERPFADVPSSAWYANTVRTATAANIVDGISIDRFDPNAPITREQMILMLIRAYESKFGTLQADQNKISFADASKVSKWAERAVIIGVEKGWLQGKEKNMLDPSNTATRAESAFILYQVLTR